MGVLFPSLILREPHLITMELLCKDLHVLLKTHKRILHVILLLLFGYHLPNSNYRYFNMVCKDCIGTLMEMDIRDAKFQAQI